MAGFSYIRKIIFGSKLSCDERHYCESHHKPYAQNAMHGHVSSVNSIFVNSSNELDQFESGIAARVSARLLL